VKKIIISYLILFSVIFLSLIASPLNVYADVSASPQEQLIFGEQKAIGEGSVRSWVKLDRNQNPISIGISLTDAAVDTAPPNDDAPPGQDGIKTQLQDGIGHQTFEYEVAIPNIPAAKIPFTHVGVNWNPYGHGPQGIFTPAHWDIHFYTIDAAYRRRISQYTDVQKRISDKQPPKGFTNTDYQLAPGTAEPRMGSHTADFSSPELAPGKFQNIFIYGIHNGKVIHWEPMLSNDFLKTVTSDTRPIKLPELYVKCGYYPNTYSVKHDTESHAYLISLDNLEYHPAHLDTKL
jgi:hypothetical protein